MADITTSSPILQRSSSSSYSKRLREGFFQSHFTDKQLTKSKVNFRNLCLTSAYFLVLMSYGFSVGALGPTLPVLSNVSATPMSKMGWIFTMKGLGVILGSIVGGKVYEGLYQKSHRFANLFLVSAILGLTGSVGLLPIVTRFSAILGTYFFYGLAAGLINMGCNLLLMWTWGSNVTGLILALNAAAGFGCAVSPLMIASGWSFNGVYSWIGASLITSALLLAFSQVLPHKQQYVPLDEFSDDFEEHEELMESGDVLQDTIPRRVKFSEKFGNFVLTLILGTALFGAIALESTFGGLLSTYLREQNIAATFRENTLMNSVFWLSMTFGRIGAAIFSRWLSPGMLLSLSANGVFGSLAMLLSSPTNPRTSWAAISLMGLSLASMYPAALSYPELSMKKFHVSANMSSFMLLMAASAELFVPLTVTKSFDTVGPRGLVWVLFGVTSLTFVAYMSMFMWSFVLNYKSRPSLEREQIPLMQADQFASPMSPSSSPVQSPMDKVVDPQHAERPATPA